MKGLKILGIQYLNGCINFELMNFEFNQFWILNFEAFIDNSELTLETLTQKNPFLLVAIGYFSTKSNCWYCNDSTTSRVRN